MLAVACIAVVASARGHRDSLPGQTYALSGLPCLENMVTADLV